MKRALVLFLIACASHLYIVRDVPAGDPEKRMVDGEKMVGHAHSSSNV